MTKAKIKFPMCQEIESEPTLNDRKFSKEKVYCIHCGGGGGAQLLQDFWIKV